MSQLQGHAETVVPGLAGGGRARGNPTGIAGTRVGTRRGVWTFGDAQFRGTTAAMKIPQPVVTIEAAPTGKGYWLIGADGAFYPFGDAPVLTARS
jgi:hypothetical protein